MLPPTHAMHSTPSSAPSHQLPNNSSALPTPTSTAVRILVEPSNIAPHLDRTTIGHHDTGYPLTNAVTPPSLRPYRIFSTRAANEVDKDYTASKRRPSLSSNSASSSSNATLKKRARLETFPLDRSEAYIDKYAMPSPSYPVNPDVYDSAVPEEEEDNDIELDQGITETLRRLPNMVHAYDTLPPDMKSYVLFQLLKRSSTNTLQFVNSVIVPALKRDFLASLPLELALHVISYLDAQSLCRAACVSHKWRSIIDSDMATWKHLLDKDRIEYKDPWQDQYVEEDDDNEQDDTDATTSTSTESILAQSDMDMAEDEEFAEPHVQWRQAWYGADLSNSPINYNAGSSSSMDIDGDSFKKGKLKVPNHPYKDIYRRHYTLRQNWQSGRAKRISFEGHPGHVVTCLQFDDEKIISGADDCLINIYDTATGQRYHSLQGHEGGVWALQYHRNTLVSGSTDRTVRVWDIRQGVCTHVFLGHTSTVRCLQIIMPTLVKGKMEPSVPLIVTGSRDSTLRVWRLPNLDRDETFHGVGVNPWYMHTLTGHNHSVRALAAHGNRLVSGSYDRAVCVWDVEEGLLLHRMEGHSQKVYAVVIDPERQRCMSGSMDSTVRIWDMEHGHCLKVLEGHSILVGLLGLTPNYLVSAAADASLRVWSPDNGGCQHVLSGHRGAITCFQHNDEKVISGSEGGLKMWDIKTGRHIRDLITGVSGVWRVAFDRRRCVAAVHRYIHILTIYTLCVEQDE
ncbi:WD40-repeat-containing domain protein [Fennellomyces sp. T-0311]|nr:WD40-repeat-containing domain protein [Fennellomyces sp. T-0311]